MQRSHPREWVTGIWAPALIVIVGATVYANSLDGVLLFDDHPHIVNDERIRPWPPWHLLSHRRPLVAMSLAANYRVGGLDVRSYHVFNISVHLLASLVLFGLVRRVLLLDRFRDRAGGAARWLAFAVALLWSVHPLQTQSVTYVIQRAESMMGLFYLLTLYCSLRGAVSKAGTRWYAAAALSCFAGMACKPVMVTCPVAVLVFDRCFLSTSLRDALARRWPLYLALIGSWALPLSSGVVRGLVAPRNAQPVVGFGYRGVTPWEYLMTQAEVLPHYVRLALWPDALCLDYGWAKVKAVGEVAASGAVVLATLAVSILGIVRRHWLGFVGGWFVIVLAPTSSFIPLQDPAYEHRMYLPLASVVVLAVMAAYRTLRFVQNTMAARIAGAVLLISAASALSCRTIQRNRDYDSELAMWSSAVELRPKNPRVHYQLANAIRESGDLATATQHYRTAVTLSPDFALALNNLANALRLQGKPEEALQMARRAVRAKPVLAEAHVTLGITLLETGADEASVVHAFETACRLQPDHVNFVMEEGKRLGAQERYREAVAPLLAVTRVQPDRTEAQYLLGLTLIRAERYGEAMRPLERAVQLDPDHAPSRQLLNELNAFLNRSPGAKLNNR